MTHRYDPDHASPMRYIVAIAAIAAYELPLYLAIINTFKTNGQIIADPVWHIPAMNRALVERATHPEARAVAAGRVCARP